jgi:hypothetical protein
MKIWRKENSCTLLVGLEISITFMENSMESKNCGYQRLRKVRRRENGKSLVNGYKIINRQEE